MNTQYYFPPNEIKASQSAAINGLNRVIKTNKKSNPIYQLAKEMKALGLTMLVASAKELSDFGMIYPCNDNNIHSWFFDTNLKDGTPQLLPYASANFRGKIYVA